ncbi:50S ribosomal protein L4 [candidate division WWE3 bacterium RIFCSPHIGHO2_01_FULL_48_15]|uniref:Large ribosomal subunit protein uL4 n=1 Tax=candidate division WWE3 bacterium RIFCSPHIGHO2_01_FULL_48_15 TaxID=1802619 RepID=A0A1F4V9Z6_UNCKA|nr:MAG: 50S ribosomal protein L4 [candidate division WWE3 bacterium RIFCSPHIGHO2_01_FULL_48_15]
MTKMRVNIYSEKGVKTPTTIELPKEIFETAPAETALRQYIHVYRINQRQGTASTKTRGEVRGGGRKPWRQKGTGRARQGSIRSPLWPGGGTTHGPQPHDFEADMPKKVRELALRWALSQKTSSGNLRVLGDFTLKTPKTAIAAKLIDKLGLKKALVILPEPNFVAARSFRNIGGTKIRTAGQLNAYDVVDSGGLLIFKESIGKLKERLEKKTESKTTKAKSESAGNKPKVETKPKLVAKPAKSAKPKRKVAVTSKAKRAKK